MSEPTDDQPNERGLMTRIDGEEVRFLVHIEPIDPADEDPTEPTGACEGKPDDSPGLAE
jgi:hypothetical protein